MTIDNDTKRHLITALGEYNTSSALLRNTTSKKLGLNIADMESLTLLSVKGVVTPTELARHTGLTTGSTTAMLDRLEKAGLIRRMPNPRDRRGVLIEADDASAAKLRALFAGVREKQDKLISNYSDEQREVIADFLSQFAGNVRTYLEETDA